MKKWFLNLFRRKCFFCGEPAPNFHAYFDVGGKVRWVSYHMCCVDAVLRSPMRMTAEGLEVATQAEAERQKKLTCMLNLQQRARELLKKRGAA